MCGSWQLHGYILQATSAWHRRHKTHKQHSAPAHPCHPGCCFNCTNCIMQPARAALHSGSWYVPRQRAGRRVSRGFDPWPLPPLLGIKARIPNGPSICTQARTGLLLPPHPRFNELIPPQTRVTVTAAKEDAKQAEVNLKLGGVFPPCRVFCHDHGSLNAECCYLAEVLHLLCPANRHTHNILLTRWSCKYVGYCPQSKPENLLHLNLCVF